MALACHHDYHSIIGDMAITQHDQLLCRLHDQLDWRATTGHSGNKSESQTGEFIKSMPGVLHAAPDPVLTNPAIVTCPPRLSSRHANI